MTTINRRTLMKAAAATAAAGFPARSITASLPSWTDGNCRQRIMDFVAAVSTEGSADYVDPADRVAVFDNDGTLWASSPCMCSSLSSSTA